VITKGADIEIIGYGNTIKTTITGIEMFHKELDRGEAGDNMGALLRGLKREDIRRGMLLIAPGSVKQAKKFLASLYVLTKEEGGRYNPFGQRYSPQLFLRTSDITVVLTYPEGTKDAEEMLVNPGDNVEMIGELLHPLAIAQGDRFTLREGGKTVATGLVTRIM